MPESEKKRRCRVCPKVKRNRRQLEEELPGEELYLLPEEVGPPVEEVEEAEEVEEEEKVCPEDAEPPQDLATAGFVLDGAFVGKRRERPPFFCPTAPKSRFENMLPVDVTNDHQEAASLKKTVVEHMAALRITSEPFCRRQSAIIATIGPSCLEVEDIKEMLMSGMNIARINMAYGDRCCQITAIENFREALKIFYGAIGFDVPVGLMMDLKGPEIRTGRICPLYACDPENPQILIERGSTVKLTTEIAFVDKGTPNLIFIDNPLLPEFVRPGMKMFIDDGQIQLLVQQVKGPEISALVEVEGHLRNYRPVHVPMVPLPTPTLTDIDIEDIELALQENFDFIVVSKLYTAEAIADLRGRLIEYLLIEKRLNEKPIMILAKISNFQALTNIDDIIKASDGIIIQRGDLGLELPPEKVFVAQREIIAKCNLANKPVICSTQLLRSMTRRPLTDRSHVFDVACCLEDGADAICLTGETAIGDFPVDTVEQAHYIIREAEAANARKHHFKEMTDRLQPPIEPIVAIGMAACIVADKVKAAAIIVLTTSGKSARIISGFRPRCPVLAVTRFDRTARQLHLWKSVCPLHYKGPCIRDNWFEDLDRRFQYAICFGFQVGFIRAGEPLVLVSGFGKSTGFTNFLRVVYTATESGIFLQHPPEYYSNVYTQKNCPRTEAKEPYLPSR